jgi:hypothetical protein
MDGDEDDSVRMQPQPAATTTVAVSLNNRSRGRCPQDRFPARTSSANNSNVFNNSSSKS